MKPGKISSLILGTAAMLAVSSAHASFTITLAQTPDELVQALLGSNSNFTIVPGSIQYSGVYLYQAGTTSDGNIVLSTGAALKHEPGKYKPSEGEKLGTGSNADLAALAGVNTNQTFDQNVLTFSFTLNDPSLNTISTSFVFASDEYSRNPDLYWRNDVFGFFVDGVNYAFLPDGSIVSVHNIDHIDGSDYGYAGRSLEYSIMATLDPNVTVHTITIAIADVMHDRYDSAVFLGSFSVSAVPEPETWAMMLAGLGLIGATAQRRRRQK
ncbi:MAG: choice-of-anchor L domain-containing protein [Betaproteobacteria bacterium]|nr:choice-of-anchor L domain-containing protein [Betaproteobacteria bacterium]